MQALTTLIMAWHGMASYDFPETVRVIWSYIALQCGIIVSRHYNSTGPVPLMMSDNFPPIEIQECLSELMLKSSRV